jgi:MFS family permease
MFGRVKMYNAGFVVFTVASILLSFDPYQGTHAALWLIGWRFLQAVGGSMLMANSAAILTDAFPPERRGFALGTNQIAALAGMFIGLVAGGLLAAWDWRAVFWINVPVGVFGTVWAYLKLRDNGVRRRSKIDWWGNITFALGLGSILVGVTYGIQPYGGNSMGWESPVVLGELIGGVVMLSSSSSSSRPDRRAHVPAQPVQDPGVHGGQPGGPAGVDRARRHPVHADHLAAGHLAAAARLHL